MHDQTFQIVALVVYFAVMMGIGYYAYRQTADHEGYMLAGRKLPRGRPRSAPGRPTCPAG